MFFLFRHVCLLFQYGSGKSEQSEQSRERERERERFISVIQYKKTQAGVYLVNKFTVHRSIRY